MKKNELIRKVAQASGQTDVTVRSILDCARDVVTESVAAGGEVMLLGLGKLAVSARGPRPARNIHTGESVVVPARKVVVFRPSVSLTDAANNR